MKKRLIYFLFTCFFLSICKTSYAVEDYVFRTLSPKGGFYYDGIKSIKEDKFGFIWILLENDLLRFDGYEYKSYLSYFKEIDDSFEWIYYNLKTDSDRNIFVFTNNGVYLYAWDNDSYELVEKIKTVNGIIDHENNMWYMANYKLYRFNLQKKISEEIKSEDNNNVVNINCFYENNDRLYIGSYYGKIYCYDYIDKKFSLLLSLPENYSIRGITQVGDKLWVLVNNYGIVIVDLYQKKVENRLDIFHEYGNEPILLKAILTDKNDNVWVGTQQGLYIIDSKTREYKRYLYSKPEEFNLPNNSIWTMYEDSKKNIWIGTFSGGLCYVNLDEGRKFTSYNADQTQLNYNIVSGFEENNDYLWIGTEGGGINCLNKRNGEFSYLIHEAGNPNSLSYNNVKSLVLDSKQNLWIATFMGGLNCYNIQTKRFSYYRSQKNNYLSLLSDDLRKIIPESDSGLWIAYQLNNTVVSYFSLEDHSFTHYYFDESDNRQYIIDITKDNKGDLWIVTRKKLYHKKNGSNAIKEVSSSEISYLNAQTLCADNDNNIWIGTINNGLLKYDIKTKSLVRYNEILALGASAIYTICADNEGDLWIGTNNGLFRYNLLKNSYLKYDESDGTQGQAYYPSSCMKGKNGELYFGGTNGFTIIKPDEADYNEYRPKVIMSDFYIDNKVVSDENRSIYNTFYSDKEIVLKYDQANFGFKFSSDNYLIASKNHFKYRLKGYDDRWIETNASGRIALYSKVPAGTYYFEILAANNDGIWGEPMTIKIVRKPAPWLSWPAYLLYILILLGIIGLIIHYYNDKRKLKMQLYLDKVDKDKKEELHQSQLRFFTNISHDFRTPLSLILAAIDNLKQEGLKDYYYNVLNNNTQRLLDLTNELMDFRTVENGKMPLQISLSNINEFVQYHASAFQDYAKKYNMNFEFLSDSNIPSEVPFDKHIIEKVVMNLLNNAFKYTKDGGIVSIETYADKSKFIPRFTTSFKVKGDTILENAFFIVVRDTGVGISEESISKVFERFYKVNTVNTDAHLGTGIGLALVKSLVLLHKGEITIYSERDKGTDMVVALSLDPEIYSDAEYSISEVSVYDENDSKQLMNYLKEDELVNEKMEDIFLREKKRILVVEDNNDLRLLISNYLSQFYEVKEAPDGLAASEFLEENDVDLIISDIMMPYKDGVSLLKSVKENINISHTPFILLTAKKGREDKMEGISSGADLYFEKPIDLKLLVLSIQNMFNSQNKLREYYSKNYFVDSAELSANEQDNMFLKKLVEILDTHLTEPNIDVNYIASKLSMSRSKLYSKVKTLTNKSIVEFILNYKLRKAARLIIEQDYTMGQITDMIGLRSQSYFSKVFREEFGETPTEFAAKHRKKNR